MHTFTLSHLNMPLHTKFLCIPIKTTHVQDSVWHTCRAYIIWTKTFLKLFSRMCSRWGNTEECVVALKCTCAFFVHIPDFHSKWKSPVPTEEGGTTSLFCAKLSLNAFNIWKMAGRFQTPFKDVLCSEFKYLFVSDNGWSHYFLAFITSIY